MISHCPWVENCVAVNNHRYFVLYVAFMVAGIIFFINLTIAYIQNLSALPESEVDCAILRPELCAELSKDTFTIYVGIWAALQLIWTVMLLFVQLTQIARAMTTFESMRGQHHALVATAVATGSLSEDGGAVDASGAGPDPTMPAKPGQQKEGCFGQWTKLLGLDTFFMIAMHGSKADEVRARRRQNPFTRGVMRNCQDFWCDGGGVQGLFNNQKESGTSFLGGEPVDYKTMYKVPTGTSMRYRSGGYEAVPGADEDV